MKFKYYSVMRPVSIGTFPGKPEHIINYDQRQKVKTADGAVIRAWGELYYGDPLTDDEIKRYELRADIQYPEIKTVGAWMNGDIAVVKIGNRFFALNGWNGTDYGHCWECKNRWTAMDDKEYTLKPVYYYETDAGVALMDTMWDMEEGTPEWEENTEKLNEIISYTITEN